MAVHFLYPCDPFKRSVPDEAYAEEFDAARARGVKCSLFSAEDFEAGKFVVCPAIESGAEVVYRGWMLTVERYAELQDAVKRHGGRMLTTTDQYRLCHHLPAWYAACADVTPKTVFLQRDADFSSRLVGLGWNAYFVKDYVKSLTTSRGSIAKTIAEVEEIVGLIEKYRGHIEGGLCIREYEELRSDTEERYFVFKQVVHAREGSVPEVVQRIAARIASPFFSIDIAMSKDGEPRLIELGDGQVSDRKQWTAMRFTEIFC
jgi:hypothetical protein